MSRVRVAFHLAAYFVLMAVLFVAANGGWW
jgi:hypothetical protein